MAVMFELSTDTFAAEHTGSVLWYVFRELAPRVTSEQYTLLHFLIRKAAHLTEYAILARLLLRAFRAGAARAWHWRWATLSFVLVAIYAGLDEYHQAFTQSRTAAVADSMLDIAGGLLALMFLWHRWQRRATATPRIPLYVAVMDEHPADVYVIAQVLHAHGLAYVLQVLESRQRALHFFDRLATQDAGGGPDLLLLDFTFPEVDTPSLLQWITALPGCRGLRIVIMTGSEDPAVEEKARALGADAVFQKPVSFQQFMALGALIKAVVFGNRHAY
jgi:CheY-like chemotaxis protein/VanZ family protein